MLTIEFSAQFKRDYKFAIKRGKNPKKLAGLLVYQIKEDILTLKMLRTGTHSDIFS